MSKEISLFSRLQLLVTANDFNFDDLFEWFFLEYKASSIQQEDGILPSSRFLIKYSKVRQLDHQNLFRNDLCFLSKELANEHEQNELLTHEKLKTFFLLISLLPKNSLPTVILSVYGSLLFPELFTNNLPSFIDRERNIVDDCVRAERLFLQWVLDRDVFKQNGHKFNVITDDAGRPLFLEKKHFIDSAITLQDVTVEGMFIPRGTLVSLSRYEKPKKVSLRETVSKSGHVMKLSDSKINGVTALRFSLFVVDGVEREMYFKEQLKAYAKYSGSPSLVDVSKIDLQELIKVCEEEL